MTTETVNIKRGATLRATFAIGSDLTGYTATAAVYLPDGTTEALTARILDPATGGLVEVEGAATATDDWPLRVLTADIKCVLDDEVVYSDTFLVNVKREVTA